MTVSRFGFAALLMASALLLQTQIADANGRPVPRGWSGGGMYRTADPPLLRHGPRHARPWHGVRHHGYGHRPMGMRSRAVLPYRYSHARPWHRHRFHAAPSYRHASYAPRYGYGHASPAYGYPYTGTSYGHANYYPAAGYGHAFYYRPGLLAWLASAASYTSSAYEYAPAQQDYSMSYYRPQCSCY